MNYCLVVFQFTIYFKFFYCLWPEKRFLTVCVTPSYKYVFLLILVHIQVFNCQMRHSGNRPIPVDRFVSSTTGQSFIDSLQSVMAANVDSPKDSFHDMHEVTKQLSIPCAGEGDNDIHMAPVFVRILEIQIVHFVYAFGSNALLRSIVSAYLEW